MNTPTNATPSSLSEWQRDFLSVIVRQSEPLTPTQAYWLKRVKAELGVRP